jgi:hypothetical protein
LIGAALESFKSRILSYLIKNKKVCFEENLDLIDIADKVAQDFQIMLGPNTIPVLLKGLAKDLDLIQQELKYSGRILVDLTDQKCARFQLEYECTDEKQIQLVELQKVNLTHDVIPALLKLSISENVEFLQMFDTSMLLNNAAFDDNTVMECVLEKLGEWQQYQRSMAIFDVDSLIGVSENMSDSSMGQSSSYSITNNRLWHQVIIEKANSKLNSSDSNAPKNHKWIVVITKNEFICKQFKALTRFPFTKMEIKEQEESLKERTCVNCRMQYTNNKNSIDSCSYHDGPIVDKRVKSKEMIHLNKDELYAGYIKQPEDKRDKFVESVVHLCCLGSFSSTGCKKVVNFIMFCF